MNEWHTLSFKFMAVLYRAEQMQAIYVYTSYKIIGKNYNCIGNNNWSRLSEVCARKSYKKICFYPTCRLNCGTHLNHIGVHFLPQSFFIGSWTDERIFSVEWNQLGFTWTDKNKRCLMKSRICTKGHTRRTLPQYWKSFAIRRRSNWIPVKPPSLLSI